MSSRDDKKELSFSKLNSLNQRIWEDGFTVSVLQDLDKTAKDVNDGTTLFERIPQAQQSGLSKGSEILTAAGIICRGCPGTESETRPIYDTNDLIGDGRIQERLVETWARIQGCWFDSPELYLASKSEIRDYGTESVVYFDIEDYVVRKLISLKHYNVLRLALDRIIIHNAIFPDSAMKVLGYGCDENHQFVIVVEQPYCAGGIVSDSERRAFMYRLGFTDAGLDYGMYLNYRTDTLYIGDLNEYNVIKGEAGIHVIDADCRLNTKTLGCGGNYSIPAPNVNFDKPCFLQK